MFAWLENPDATYDQLARSVREQGVTISTQGLEKRFDKNAAQLLQNALDECINRIARLPGQIPIELLNRFNGVYLTDCSMLNLPAEFFDQWPGTGKEGTATHAQLKLEVLFELGRGQLIGLNLLAGRVHDSRGELANRPLGSGSLRVHDLGYWDLTRMAEQNRRGEFRLSRYKHGTTLSTDSDEPFELAEWLTQQERQGMLQAECQVIVGNRGLLSARLIAHRMPITVARKRRRALYKRNRSHPYLLIHKKRHNRSRQPLSSLLQYIGQILPGI